MEEFLSDVSLVLEAFLVLQFSTRELLLFLLLCMGKKKSSLELLNWSIRTSFSSIYSLGFLWNQDSKSEVKKPMRIPFPVSRLFQELRLAYLKAIKSLLKRCMWFYRAHTSQLFSLLWHFCWDRPKSAKCYKSVSLVINPTQNIKLFINSCNIKLTFWEANLAAVY